MRWQTMLCILASIDSYHNLHIIILTAYRTDQEYLQVD